MASCSSVSSFLSLPRELRYEIYDHLCGQEPVSYPFYASPITSFDQTPPATNLQLTCRSIYEEIRTYFYGKVTPSFVAQSVLHVARSDIHHLALRAIRQAKKAEIVLIWDIPPVIAETPWCNWPRAMNGWLDELVDLLLDESENLELVVVSMRDATEDMNWEKKTRLLQPLNRLKGSVLFKIGQIAAADTEAEALKVTLRGYLEELNK